MMSPQVESKLPIHPSEQWVLEGQRGKRNSKDFAPAEETSTSTSTLSINAQMTALVDALKAAEESRKVESEDFRQKLESIMTQVEGFAKSVNSLRQEKDKPVDVPPSDPLCEAVEKENSEEEVQILAKKKGKSRPQTRRKVILVEDRRDFAGCELLVEEDRQLITKLLSMEINYESIFVNKWNGEVTRYNIHEVLFGKNIGDDMIDSAVQLLEESCSLSDYKKWEYLPTLIVSSIHAAKRASISQKAQRLFESFPAATDLEHLGKLDFLFFVLHTTNHWHLLVVDLKNRCFISYNSIKGNKSYDAAVRNWVKVLHHFFRSGAMQDAIEDWELKFDMDCPSQPPNSNECGMYVIKFMEELAKPKEGGSWKFHEEHMPLFRCELVLELLRKWESTM